MTIPTFDIPSSSPTSVYGSGAWLGQPVDITGWPDFKMSDAIVAQLKADADQAKVKLDLSNITGAQLAAAIAHLSAGNAEQRSIVAQIQQMLWYAGAYPSSVKSFTELQPGTFSGQDTKALASMVTSAQQTGVPFGSYLNSSATYGQANGIVQRLEGATTNLVQPPNAITEDAALRNAAQKLIGEDPTPQQLAEFQAYSTQLWLDGNKKAMLAQQQGVNNQLPDAATLAQAIADRQNPPAAPPATMGAYAPASQARDPDFVGPNPAFAQYNAQMAQDQQALGQVNAAADALQATGGIKSVPLPPDPANAAEDWLTRNDQTQVQAHNLSNVMDALQVLTVGAAKVYGRDTFQQNRN